MFRNFACLAFFSVILSFRTFAAHPADTLTAAFWNCENFYDTFDDPKKNDDEFLPSSKKNWTGERFEKKLANLSRVIRLMNGAKGPDILGVAEVENRGVLEALVSGYLKDMNYGIAHLESPDERGIDVALLYRKSKFKQASVAGDTVILPDKYPTRLILRVQLESKEHGELTVYVNHWPSRRSGQDKSEINRVTAAEVLKADVNSLLTRNQSANIIIMGDFNDEPDNTSILNTLNAGLYTCDSASQTNSLHNLAWETKKKGEGTLRYRDVWNQLDQIIVSDAMAKKYVCGSFEIFKPEFIIEQEGKFKGGPLPTYGGDKYLGGFSDHFSVLAKFTLSSK